LKFDKEGEFWYHAKYTASGTVVVKAAAVN